MKSKMVKYLGGKCIICEYDKTHEALSFHHVHPEYKDHGLNRLNSRRWENVIDELNKCVLLCVRCHHEYHHSTLKEHHEEIIMHAFNTR